MKILSSLFICIAAVALLSSCGNRHQLATDYISLDSSEGFVTLSLRSGGAALLVLGKFDEETQTDKELKRISGNWSLSEGVVTLTSPEFSVVLQQTKQVLMIKGESITLKALKCQSPNAPEYLRSVTLIDKNENDKFLDRVIGVEEN